MKPVEKVSGMITDVAAGKIFGGTVFISGGKISRIEADGRTYHQYILPGFTDAHIHIESSMLTPYEFARIAMIHGTVSTISDPHEIANVCGTEGVMYMLENARGAGLKFHFGAPSCVPATAFESAGAVLGPSEVKKLLQRGDIYYLSEMMNYPGVLNRDHDVWQKIGAAIDCGKPIDGHAPGLRGKEAEKYAAAGISTDHECFTLEEALDKLQHGMKILIREGSAARNFKALIPLLKEYASSCMFCCDDKHPDDLLEGHINLHVRRAVAAGYDVMDVLRCACVNPVLHYKMRTGLLQPGDAADFIVTDNLVDFNVQQTVIDGLVYAEKGICYLPGRSHDHINNFSSTKKNPADFEMQASSEKIKVIQAHDGQLITSSFETSCKTKNGNAASDESRDILKLCVVNRYNDAPVSCAFIKGFNLKNCAIASSIAHDSHNIIAVGADDDMMCRAVNLVIEHKGGLSFVADNEEHALSLPVAGLMSDGDAMSTGNAYADLSRRVKQAGCTLQAPFMTLSFMALLVIPQLKLSDKGLFDGEKFRFTSLFT